MGMKFKIFLLTLLVACMTFGLSANVFAADTFNRYDAAGADAYRFYTDTWSD